MKTEHWIGSLRDTFKPLNLNEVKVFHDQFEK